MRFVTTMKKIALSVILTATLGSAASATIYTAVLSGSFSSALTWGGVLPGSLLTSDIIIIPTGITVTLTSDEIFSGSSSMMVDGSLVSAGGELIMTSGSLTGSGSISVDSLAMDLGSGLTFTGSIATSALTTVGSTVSSSAHIAVSHALHLAGGVLSITGGSLTLGSGAIITLSGGTITVGGSGSLSLSSVYSVVYDVAGTAGAELSGSGLSGITISAPGAVTLSGDATLHGVLTLTSGMLSLAGHTLTLGSGADISALGTGTITGSALSDIIIATTGSVTGSLRFSPGGAVLHGLSLDLGSPGETVSLGSDLSVTGILGLTSGRLTLGAHDLTISAGGLISGGTSGSYVITDGAGSLVMHLTAGMADSFAVGTSAGFAPIIVAGGTGTSAGDVSVNVMSGVLSGGTTGTLISSTDALVDATWHVSSTATAGINYTLTAMWSAGMEVNGFDRTHALISHFTGGAWDVTTATSAGVSGSMYYMSRAGITSLSPFMVTNPSTISALYTGTLVGNDNFTVYPNPVAGTLSFSTPAQIDNVCIYDICGRQIKSISKPARSIPVGDLPSGTYLVRFTGEGMTAVRKIVKE